MSIDKSFILTIPQPCNENWEAMQPGTNGRFCSQCQKNIVDISALSDEALYQLIQSGKQVCGRFHPNQLNRKITTAKRKKTFYVRVAGLVAALLAFLTMKHVAARSPRQIYPTMQTPAMQPITLADSTIIISGTIRSGDNLPLPDAAVAFDGKEVTRTDSMGKFSFELPADLLHDNHLITAAYEGLVPVTQSYHTTMKGPVIYNFLLLPPARYRQHVLGRVAVSTIDPFFIALYSPSYDISDNIKAVWTAIASRMRSEPSQSILIRGNAAQKDKKIFVSRWQKRLKYYLTEMEGIAAERIFIDAPVVNGKERTGITIASARE